MAFIYTNSSSTMASLDFAARLNLVNSCGKFLIKKNMQLMKNDSMESIYTNSGSAMASLDFTARLNVVRWNLNISGQRTLFQELHLFLYEEIPTSLN